MKTPCFLLLGFLLGAVLPSWAVLGQPVQSVQLDRQHLKGQLRLIQRAGYSVQRIESADGGVVREFVSPEGMVFGVAWQGRSVPDLRQLLGSYFPAFQHAAQQAAQAPRRRRGPMVVRVNGLVVEVAGHLRQFHGRAFVDNLIPATLSQAVVQ